MGDRRDDDPTMEDIRRMAEKAGAKKIKLKRKLLKKLQPPDNP